MAKTKLESALEENEALRLEITTLQMALEEAEKSEWISVSSGNLPEISERVWVKKKSKKPELRPWHFCGEYWSRGADYKDEKLSEHRES